MVINLLLNAADAMPQRREPDAAHFAPRALPPLQNFKGVLPRLPCVCLTIQDTGAGSKSGTWRPSSIRFSPPSPKARAWAFTTPVAMEKHHGAISVDLQGWRRHEFPCGCRRPTFPNRPASRNKSAARGDPPQSCCLWADRARSWTKRPELLRSHNYHVVVAIGGDNPESCSNPRDYEFRARCLLAESNDHGPSNRCSRNCGGTEELKVILKPTGCCQDDLNGQLLKEVDLLISPDLSQTGMLARLKRPSTRRPDNPMIWKSPPKKPNTPDSHRGRRGNRPGGLARHTCCARVTRSSPPRMQSMP